MTMTVVRPRNDDHHIVIGVFNIDSQMKREQSMAAESKAFGIIAKALAERYEIIYSVNIVNDEYVEYSANRQYSNLEVGERGKDFFAACRINMQKALYPEDIPMMMESMKKENLLRTLDEYEKTFLNYRQIIDGKPQYMTLYAIRPKDDLDHLIIAVANVDASKRMEIAYQNAMDLANKDALTGVKNKRSYVQMEIEIDKQIKKSELSEFAVAVCDVNYLKHVNDTHGHSVGDEYIKKACQTICRVFKHSPVFRIGGDEFAVILKGEDYINRKSLLEELDDVLCNNRQDGVRIIAYGLSDFAPGRDMRLQDVFERADHLMYEDKKNCKHILD